MWVAYSKKGKRIESDFWDWACMEKVIADYVDELGISDKEAYAKFWEDVRNYDPEDFEACLNGRTFEEAIGDGNFDDLRSDYLRTLDIVCWTKNGTADYENSPREMAEKLMEFIRDFSDDAKELEAETDSVAELFTKLQQSEEFNSLAHHLDLMFMDRVFNLEKDVRDDR